MGLFDNWKNFDLKKLPGPLGKIASAANDSYKAATHSAATLLKGTPLGGVAHGLELASVGKTAEAAKEYAHAIVSAVPGLNSLPGVAAATDAIISIGSGARKLSGVAATVTANQSNAAPTPPLDPTLFRAMQHASSPSVQQQMQQQASLGARGRRAPKVFNKEQWKQFTSDPRTVGGTQPWAVP